MTTKEWRNRFGAKLDKLITARGCTRRDFAEEIGVSDRAIDHYIHGRRTPNAFALMKMANVFGCSLTELADFGEKIED